MQVSEFNHSVNTAGLMLPPHGVTVVWEWEWGEDEDSASDVSEESPRSPQQNNPHLHSDLESDSENESSLPTQTHTVTFKCVGSTYDSNAQSALSKASKLVRDGREIPTKLQPEPTNQYDAKAIAFMCLIDDKWQKIGYIVKECLEHVHAALSARSILSVKLSWAKYLVCWTQSGPGYFAAINVTLRGEWHNDVLRSRSTR